MAPWNYPVMLCMEPLIDAVVEGGRAENNELLEQRFDHIFFTESTSVGKIVLEKVARYVTPVTLELGGKSPCIVDKTADIKVAARRIVFGKILNSGQTCVAPDYLIVHPEVKNALFEAMKKELIGMLGEKPLEAEEYPRMVNEKHYERVMGLIKGEEVIVGGYGNPDTLQIAPTILDKVTLESPVMQEEIFGTVVAFTCIFWWRLHQRYDYAFDIFRDGIWWSRRKRNEKLSRKSRI